MEVYEMHTATVCHQRSKVAELLNMQDRVTECSGQFGQPYRAVLLKVTGLINMQGAGEYSSLVLLS